MDTQVLTARKIEAPVTVPLMDLAAEHERLRPELLRVWRGLLDSTAFVGGPQIAAFEQDFAAFCEVRHAVGVANGTDALVLALKALGVGRDDEVLVPANSFVATAEAVVHAGARPVFVDVDPRTFTIDAAQIEHHITPRTKAVIPVHLYGQPAEMDAVIAIAKKHGLKVIEDAAQAHGARYRSRRAGSMGDAGCFSFYPAKNLGACGDAGAVVTNNEAVAVAIRRLRDHGGLKKYQHDTIGYNSRLDTLQAAVLQLKLPHLEGRNAVRRRHAHIYDDLLSRIPGVAAPSVPAHIESVYHLYVVRIERGNRAELQRYFLERGVQTGLHYPEPIHRTEAFRAFAGEACPVAEQHARTILSLPLFPEMETRQVRYVATLLKDYMETRG